MKQRMEYSNKVYLMVEQIDNDEFDYLKFYNMTDALDWLKDYPVYTHNWTLSSEPVGLPESEYTFWNEVEKQHFVTCPICQTAYEGDECPMTHEDDTPQFDTWEEKRGEK